MLSDSFLAKEANRLFTLPFPPAGEDRKSMVREYVYALRGRVSTKEHCIAVIDWLVQHSPRCPTPADVIAATDSVRAPDKAKAPMGCSECHGSGYVSFTRLVKLKNGMEYDADFSKPCACELGAFIQPEYDKRKNVTPGRSQDLG